MPRYMLLLHDDPAAFAAMSPAEMQAIIEQYVAWGNRLREHGLLAGSDKLAGDPGRVIRRQGGEVRVTDGPYSESKEVLGGYFTIHADSYAQAIERARDCPHLEFGGTIEVREVEDMTGR